MCSPLVQETVLRRLSRRNFLRLAGVSAASIGLAACAVPELPKQTAPAQESPQGTPTYSFSRVVDLTHTLWPTFPTFGGTQNYEEEVLFTFEKDGFNMKRWLLVEHTGTHMDAPIHFSANGWSADQIPVANLVGPLAIIDIRKKAQENPDAQLTPDDIKTWESQHGPLPAKGIVAMYSGWEEFVKSDKFRNADENGVMHFPGFHVEAVQFLLEERDIVGIVVDTLSLDYGPSTTFDTHYAWLPENRWGMENVANLGELPPKGAILVAGGPTIQGATGGPSRVIALV
ncbi:MAG TPA: twin-arginine translocation signal domain-containing protein [Anaerolineae bacterium]|nr:twin-arginine translocation signal domain-containing protein [Anaerolineae bacterium]